MYHIPDSVKTNARSHIYEYLLAQVYDYQRIIKLKQMAELAVENQKIKNLYYPCFMHEGIWYLSPYNSSMPYNLSTPYNSSTFNRSIDPSLKTRAFEIMEESFEDVTIKANISDYFRKLVQNCRKVSCINSFLPGSIQIPDRFSYNFDDGEPLNEDETESLMQKTIKCGSALKQLYMEKLIMAKVTS